MNLVIQEIAFGGRGVGRLSNGRVVFVPFVGEGETVSVEILREHKSYLEGRLLAVVDAPSPHRVEPRCPYFGRCGGCSYQHLDIEEQRRIKRNQVASVLRRLGHFKEDVAVEPTVPSPLEYGYRNRITIHIADDAIGFFGHGSGDQATRGGGERALVDVKHCPISDPAVNEALAVFRKHPWRREGHCTLRGSERPGGFHQTNDGAAGKLLEIVESVLFREGGPGHTHLLDAYCGAGFFARHLRERFERIVGIEWDRRAVEQARRDAGANEQYLCGDVATLLAGELENIRDLRAVLIVDPPAEGLATGVRRSIRAAPPAEMVYVSCDSATLARDLESLRNEYRLLSVTPLDMFPQTAEIEVVAHLVRNDPAAER